MKKLFLLLSVLLGMSVNVAYADITAKPIFPKSYPFPMEIAMSVDEEGVAVMKPGVAHESGRNVEVVIFGDKFTVEKQFTLNNVLTEHKDDGSENIALADLWSNLADFKDVVVTKNFFVKNDKWCVVLEYSTGSLATDNLVVKYKVMDEDGNLLGELPENQSNDPGIYLDGIYQGTPYLGIVTCTGDYPYIDTWIQLYTFTGEGQSGIVPMAVNTISRAYPNPLPAGRTFNVELSRPADEATYFSVIDMNGRQVVRRRIPAGESSYRLAGSRFAHGHYVYTVIYKDGESVSGRLMAE